MHSERANAPTSITITRLRRAELSAAHVEAWSNLQRGNPALANPFFRPEYSELVSSVRDKVEVAIVESNGQYTGFWPFQRDGQNVARPVGLTLCGCQGAITAPDFQWSPLQVVKQCGLKAWAFEHLIGSQSSLRDFHWSYSNSPVINLDGGFDEYCRKKRESNSRTLPKTLQKMRKLEREVGPLRFVADCQDDSLVELIIEWKREQYRRIRAVDHLAPEWAREVVRRIARYRSSEFSGMASALYAGDHLVAAHLGLRSRNVLHGWFPTYSCQFERYSPGLIFWLELVRHAASVGIERIDLGKGDERFKQSLKTDDVTVAEGAVDLRAASRAIRKALWLTRCRIRRSPLAVPLRYLVGSLRARRNQQTLGPTFS